jgi:YVTN family beta-propeller protein
MRAARTIALFSVFCAVCACRAKPAEVTLAVANTNARNVQIVDGRTWKVIASIPLPGKPHSVDLEPGGRRLWASNLQGDTVSVIDLASRRIETSVRICHGPVAVAFKASKAFAACGDGYMAVIDTSTLKVMKTEAIGFAPHDIVAGPGDRIWAVNRGSNDLSEIDPATGALVSRHAAAPFAYGVAFSPDAAYAFVTSKKWNAVSVISMEDFQILGSIKVGNEPSLIVASRDGTRLYVTDRADGTVSVINARTFQVTDTITVDKEPDGIALSGDDSTLFVANFASNTLSVIDVKARRVTRRVPVGDGPDDVVIVPRA